MRMPDPFAAARARAHRTAAAAFEDASIAESLDGGDGGSGAKPLPVRALTAATGGIAAAKPRPKSPGLGPGKVRSGGSSEEVVPLMTEKGFVSCMTCIHPDMPPTTVKRLFRKGCDIAHRNCLAKFATVWRKCVGGGYGLLFFFFLFSFFFLACQHPSPPPSWG